VTDWYAYDRYGNKKAVFSTYHNFSDGWFLILPEDWKDQIAVRRDDTVSGERTLIFSYITGSNTVPFLRIYALSGDNKEDRAALENRVRLPEKGETLYAFEILRTDLPITVSKGVITENFKLLYSDWATGVM
jgi:hypothetical protein